ncbi:hypothetical protein [Nocardioides sp. InS609-2]|uniref:hypothetical protein n=1 Tax=Nocardioides sp. InS609-2 TaxID=2760705 RepID=UPI0020C02BEE|nr:hypothetical protein [Nocardioides sp. InS609-2]
MASGTIIVVDDEPKIRDLVRTYLEREGYQVFDTEAGMTLSGSCSGSIPILLCSTSDCPTYRGRR